MLPGETKPNVIVFGETGAGKTAVINMLDRDFDLPKVPREAGVTLSNQCYNRMISGSKIRVFEVVGLNLSPTRIVDPRDTLLTLYNLISQLQDGVNLLVFVMRAPRIKVITKQNYDMFFNLFCRGNVPIVIVITGLENEENMDQWWDENKVAFDANEMSFSASACITTTTLRNGVLCLAAEYEESKKKIKALIFCFLAEEGWKMETFPWFTSTVVQLRDIFATALDCKPEVLTRALFDVLRVYVGFSSREAKVVACEVAKTTTSLS